MTKSTDKTPSAEESAKAVATPTTTSKPSSASKPKSGKVPGAQALRTPPRKPTFVRLKNRMRQVITPSVLGENGRDVEPLRLGPLETSRPVAMDRLTAYALNLIEQGRLTTA